MSYYISRLLRSQLIAVALLGCMLYPYPSVWVGIVQGVLAAIFVLYLPGYRISYIVFEKGELTEFERFVMSIAISVAVIVFVSLYMHYFGLIISLIQVFLVSLLVIIVSFCLVRALSKNRSRH